jgi:hypothetical protein
MRLCSRWDLAIRARAVFHDDAVALVRVRAGGLTYLLEPHEAQLLARELLDSLKQIEAVCAIEGGQP